MALARKVGARGLRSILEVLLAGVQYRLDEYKGQTWKVDGIIDFLKAHPTREVLVSDSSEKIARCA